MVVAGIDVALGQGAVIGVGVVTNGKVIGYGIKGMKPKPQAKLFDERLLQLPSLILSVADRHTLELAIVEKPMANRNNNSFELQWLYGAVINGFMRRGVPVLSVPTPTIRRIVAGAGNMKKNVFVEFLSKKYGNKRHDVLEAMAYAKLGWDIANGKYPKEPLTDAYLYAKKYYASQEGE